jgi:hypothetical protein
MFSPAWRGAGPMARGGRSGRRPWQTGGAVGPAQAEGLPHKMKSFRGNGAKLSGIGQSWPQSRPSGRLDPLESGSAG